MPSVAVPDVSIAIVISLECVLLAVAVIVIVDPESSLIDVDEIVNDTFGRLQELPDPASPTIKPPAASAPYPKEEELISFGDLANLINTL